MSGVLLAFLWAVLPPAAAPAAPPPLRSTGFSLERPAQVVAEVRARCPRCDWGRRGREAAVLRVSLDGAYSQHLVLARGSGSYRLALGGLEAGDHRLELALDGGLTCRGAGRVAIEDVRIEPAAPGSPQEEALRRAPLLYLREDSLPRFTDVPLLMWYEEDRTAAGRRLRYSVIFSNEDGGTPPDRLMATWGRVTDIEYVYGVELADDGRVLHEEYQGKDHALPAFAGRHQGARPLLWVVTRNNMVGESGGVTYRVAPAPVPFALREVSREAVMDAHPWTYQVSAHEVRREGRVRAGAPPGSKQIPDPRRFVYLEACAEMEDAALAFAVGIAQGGRTHWTWSDAGELRWRIARSRDNGDNGCFRGAVAVPAGAPVTGLRFRSFPRSLRKGETALPPGAGRAVLRRVNRLFRLRPDDTPGPDLVTWSGELAMDAGGAPVELPLPQGSATGGKASSF
ncbi:MAG TPA: hypothetical protein VFO85_19750 [Vicinamibacteria bacterium]|nr:hypothetical protein [Vicinamibacteria bacterium]